MPTSNILSVADATIHGPRQADYGDKRQDFAQIAMIWQGLLAHKLMPTSAITPEDVALCMIAVKMARLAKSPDHLDSQIDIAGYTGCYNELQNERALKKPLIGATNDARDHGHK